MRKALITGGAGFIGSHLAERLASLGVEVVVLDDLRTGSEGRLSGLPVRLVRGCVTDPAMVASLAEGADAIFHLASLVSVPESLALPAESVRVNVGGTLNVLEAARRAEVGRVVFASSAAVYGEAASPQREDALPAPLSPYGVTKLDGEHYFEIWRHTYGVSTVSLRFFNVFGPRQQTSGPYGSAVPTFIRRALAGEDLEIHGDGGQTRDFVHISEAVDAYLLAAARPDMHGVLNVGSGRGTSVLELAERIRAEVGSASRIVHGPARAGDIRHSVADVERIAGFGYRSRTSLEDGLADTVAWFRSGRVPAGA